MAPSPFRRRKPADSLRNLAIAEAALALARDRVGRRSRRPSGRMLLLGGVAAAAGAAVLLKRDKVAGLLPGRGQTYEPPPAPPQPGPSNYDAPGPVANTATPVPAPDPQQPAAIDEAAEEAAAAAEAANIGGVVSDYAGPSDLPATEAERPLAEAGEGEAEGQEQAELDLETAAQPTAPGVSDSERQIDDTIEQAANPHAGEQIEPVKPADAEAEADREPSASSTAWTPPVAPSGAGETAREPEATAEPLEPAPFDPPAAAKEDESSESEAADSPEAEGETQNTGEAEGKAGDTGEADDGKDEGGSDWRTWSGRSINP
jgi:hypothetical protein